MNEQMEQFRNLIEMAQTGTNGAGAVSILREICREAAEQTPVGDLVKMAQFLYDLRKKAAQDHAETN